MFLCIVSADEMISRYPDSNTSSDSESSDSSSSASSNIGSPVPLQCRPNIGPLEESNVLNRIKEFLPLFKSATIRLSDPVMTSVKSGDDCSLEVKTRDMDIDSQSETSSMCSMGVEIDLGLGVFDVNGDLDENVLKASGTEIVDSSADMDQVTLGTSKDGGPLIVEVGIEGNSE